MTTFVTASDTASATAWPSVTRPAAARTAPDGHPRPAPRTAGRLMSRGGGAGPAKLPEGFPARDQPHLLERTTASNERRRGARRGACDTSGQLAWRCREAHAVLESLPRLSAARPEHDRRRLRCESRPFPGRRREGPLRYRIEADRTARTMPRRQRNSRIAIARGRRRSRLPTAVNRRARQGHGVGSLKS